MVDIRAAFAMGEPAPASLPVGRSNRATEESAEPDRTTGDAGTGSESAGEWTGDQRSHGGLSLRALMIAVTIACSARSAGAQTLVGPQTQRLRVAVMDLSGSALKIQSTMMPIGQPMPMPQPQYQQQPYGQPQGKQTTISVAIPPPSEFARGLTEMLTSVLIKTGRFIVLERAAMQQIEQEQAIGAAGKTTKETAAQQGVLLGAQVLITGDITGFTFEKSSIGGQLTNVVKGLSVASERVSAEVIIDLRLIDASTGEVLYATKGSGKASQTGIAADLTRNEKSYSADATFTTPLGQASRQAIQNAAVGILVGMPKIRWSARVADVRDGVVYVTASAADGMRPGVELEVFQAGEALVDPGTGKSLGAPEKYVGTVVIENVLERFSTAKVVFGEGVGRGHLVRLKGDGNGRRP